MAVQVEALHPLLKQFKEEVCEKSKKVDPSEERDWYDLSYGFFLAKGAAPELAEELATKARYKYEYWS